jgi:hypothetical protein
MKLLSWSLIIGPHSSEDNLMLMIMIFGCILVASLATAGLIASAQNAQDEAHELLSVNQTELS